MKESEKEFKYALRACQKSKEKRNSDAMSRCLQDNSDLSKKICKIIIRIRKSRLLFEVGGETGNKAVTFMWKKHFAAYLNSSKKCEIGKLLKQNINSHSKF